MTAITEINRVNSSAINAEKPDIATTKSKWNARIVAHEVADFLTYSVYGRIEIAAQGIFKVLVKMPYRLINASLKSTILMGKAIVYYPAALFNIKIDLKSYKNDVEIQLSQAILSLAYGISFIALSILSIVTPSLKKTICNVYLNCEFEDYIQNPSNVFLKSDSTDLKNKSLPYIVRRVMKDKLKGQVNDAQKLLEKAKIYVDGLEPKAKIIQNAKERSKEATEKFRAAESNVSEKEKELEKAKKELNAVYWSTWRFSDNQKRTDLSDKRKILNEAKKALKEANTERNKQYKALPIILETSTKEIDKAEGFDENTGWLDRTFYIGVENKFSTASSAYTYAKDQFDSLKQQFDAL